MTEHLFGLVLDSRAYRGGPSAIRARREGASSEVFSYGSGQRDRLADQVAYARTRSPFYRELYRGLPDQVTDYAHLPATSKPQLMFRFDDWVTDPAVTLDRARAFIDDPA